MDNAVAAVAQRLGVVLPLGVPALPVPDWSYLTEKLLAVAGKADQTTAIRNALKQIGYEVPAHRQAVFQAGCRAALNLLGGEAASQYLVSNPGIFRGSEPDITRGLARCCQESGANRSRAMLEALFAAAGIDMPKIMGDKTATVSIEAERQHQGRRRLDWQFICVSGEGRLECNVEVKFKARLGRDQAAAMNRTTGHARRRGAQCRNFLLVPETAQYQRQNGFHVLSWRRFVCEFSARIRDMTANEPLAQYLHAAMRKAEVVHD